ncbi:MAG: hypothetical protein M1818_005340 [Claussenomyces sp. TS43310]|nr:MAG: hypothetical protein M1818_005340 [Claussenomyces sp. TS43310]
MSSHERRQRGVRISGKSPIASPPRAALQGRSARVEGPQPSESSPSSSTPEADGPSPVGPHGEGSNADTVDKASRIAMLEIEMAKMEDEFSRELLQLGEKITNEAETSQYWQQKHSKLHQQFLKVDADLRILRHENSLKEQQREERDRDIKTRISSLVLDRDTLREAYHVQLGDLKAKDQEIVQLRSQIKGLKDFVSVNSRTEGQIADEVLGEMMRGLGSGLQNWVIVNFRKSKMSGLCRSTWKIRVLSKYTDVSRLSEDTRESLSTLVPTFEDLAASAKIHLLQSIVSRLFVNCIFESYYVGLPNERSVEIQNTENYLASLMGDKASVNQWRSATLASIRKGSSEGMRLATEDFTSSLITRISVILDAITDVQVTQARGTSLRALIASAIDLSRLLRVQKAVFKAVMPVIEAHQVNTFDTVTMEDIGGEDEDGLAYRQISCVTFPGLVKEGDESGEQTQLRNVVAKARVLCSLD